MKTGKQILKGINLEIKPGEVHAIMGPNGAGKIYTSVIAERRLRLQMVKILLKEKTFVEDAPEERAHKGIFPFLSNIQWKSRSYCEPILLKLRLMKPEIK